MLDKELENKKYHEWIKFEIKRLEKKLEDTFIELDDIKRKAKNEGIIK